MKQEKIIIPSIDDDGIKFVTVERIELLFCCCCFNEPSPVNDDDAVVVVSVVDCLIRNNLRRRLHTIEPSIYIASTNSVTNNIGIVANIAIVHKQQTVIIARRFVQR
ncbi:hypothetical protein DERP_010718 [Dermatophagoides pteronyssinus]|uniref:Uncharacterized protein n=1 Tax=Dermatophagoides pteronyssinus TaxID=6956 RepID=A0ABQ8J724_DERPT|nr:hypothetical protein DERP_010718 [Dermatophagoides pteronyssinus]